MNQLASMSAATDFIESTMDDNPFSHSRSTGPCLSQKSKNSANFQRYSALTTNFGGAGVSAMYGLLVATVGETLTAKRKIVISSCVTHN